MLLLIVALTSQNIFCQPTFTKTINVFVTDAASGRPIDGAKVTYQGMLTNQTKTAGADGKVTFEIPLIGNSATATLLVNDGAFINAHKDQTIPVTLVKDQAVYNIQVALKSDYKRITVTVVDDDTKEAIQDVSVVLSGIREGKDEKAQTDGRGIASIDVLLMTRTFKVMMVISKLGYETMNTSIQVNEKTDQYAVTISLKKDKLSRILRVVVLSQKDNSPIPEATVTADQSLLTLFTGVTDANGIANIVITAGGKFDVTVRAGNFEPETRTIEINRFGDQQVYTMPFNLKKKLFDRELKVMVLEEYEPGLTRPKKEAIIQINNEFAGVTGADGTGSFKHHGTMGEMITVKASATDYDPDEKKIVVGGDDWRYFPPQYDKAVLTIKYNPAVLKLTVQVLDEKTNKPITTASVEAVYNNSSFSPESFSRGNYVFKIKKTATQNYIRVKVKAEQYEEKWSDVTPDLLQSNERIFTVFLKKQEAQKPGSEKKFGPFAVGLTEWVPTGVQIKKGKQFRVDVSGVLTYPDANGKTIEMHPDGHGYWGWFVLKVKIGPDMWDVGSHGWNYAKEDGVIELGAPRGSTFVPGDGKGVSGSWSVSLFVVDGVQVKDAKVKQAEDAKAKQSAETKLQNAKNDLELLKQLSTGAKALNKSPEQVSQEVKRIVLQYKLTVSATGAELDEFILTVKHYQEYFYNRVGTPTQEELNTYFPNIFSLIDQLNDMIRSNSF